MLRPNDPSLIFATISPNQQTYQNMSPCSCAAGAQARKSQERWTLRIGGPTRNRAWIGDGRAPAAGEKPNLVLLGIVASIEDARWAAAFTAQEHQVSSAKM